MDGFNHEHLVQLVSVAARFNFQIDTPAFILLGVESTGKTSMLEAITKSKIGYSAIEMATKCPVKYVLRRCDDPEFRVDNQVVQEAQIANNVESHMKRLEKVVKDELVVEITGPDVPDLVIIDLPGLNLQDQQIIDDITAILEVYCRNENSFLIGVAECAVTMGQCASFAQIREVLNKVDADLEGRVMVLLNKVDKVFEDWLALPRGTLEEHLKHGWEADYPTYFMSS